MAGARIAMVFACAVRAKGLAGDMVRLSGRW